MSKVYFYIFRTDKEVKKIEDLQKYGAKYVALSLNKDKDLDRRLEILIEEAFDRLKEG